MKKKAFIPALAMLVMVAIALSTATYAWFTVRRTADVTVSQITATTGTDLEISTNSTTWAKSVQLALPFNNDKTTDISGNGLNFYKAKFDPSNAITGYEQIPSTSPDGNWVEFPLWFRAKNAMNVYLSSDSSVIPNNSAVTTSTKSTYGSFSKDHIAAATRVAFLNKDSNAVNLVWAPNSTTQLIQGTTDTNWQLNTGMSSDTNTYQFVNGTAHSANLKDIAYTPVGTSGGAKINWADGTEDLTAGALETFRAGDIPLTVNTINSVGQIGTAAAEGAYAEMKIQVRIWVEGTDREAREALANGIFNTKLGFVGYELAKEEAPVLGSFTATNTVGTLRQVALTGGTQTYDKLEYAIYSTSNNLTSAYADMPSDGIILLNKDMYGYTVYVRTKATAGKVASLPISFVFDKPAYTFTAVTTDDSTNKLVLGLNTGSFEYSTAANAAWLPLTGTTVFEGNQTVYVRRVEDVSYATTVYATAGTPNALSFTKDTPIVPIVLTDGTAVLGSINYDTATHVFDFAIGEKALEYRVDGDLTETYYALDDVTAFTSLIGQKIYIRYAATSILNPSADVEFTIA